MEININGLDSEGVASAVASAISGKGIVGTATRSGNTVTVTTSYAGSSANAATVKGWNQPAATVEKDLGGGDSKKYGRSGAPATGLGNKSATGIPSSSGTYIPPTYKDYRDPETDITTQVVDVPGHYEGGTGGSKASLVLNIGAADGGSGFSVKASGASGSAYIRLVEGNGISRDATGVYEVGRNANLTDYKLCTWDTYNPNNSTDSYVRLSMANGQMTLESVHVGVTISTTDGIDEEAAADAIPSKKVNVDFAGVRDYSGTVTAATGGVDRGAYHQGDRAYYIMDLMAYDTDDADKLEKFIGELKGKAINLSNRGTTEFIDSKVPTSLDAIRHLAGGTSVDLNSLRSAVAGGTSIADAFINLMKNRSGFSDGSDAGAGTKGLKVTAYYGELAGNSETISFSKGNMSSYTIDFNSVASGVPLPDGLDGKGFRLYCATCPEQWFNFQFKSKDDPSDADRPASGQSGADLKTTIIDVSGVKDAKSLVEAIYNQGGDALEHIMNGHSHMLHFAADPEAGKLTVYDDRMFDLSSSYYRRLYPDLQERGAKLADGVLDDVRRDTRSIFVKDLVIHHTDKASMNIHIQIPQTSMDHLFNYIPGVADWKDYNVLTQANREKLLGNQAGRLSPDGSRMVKQDEPGLLDRAIQYLTDANTLVGAQTSRLEMTHDNIITQQESTTASESTIRDADMAKEMTEYTKANVLTQAAQSMLAQANQNSSSVLSLLQ